MAKEYGTSGGEQPHENKKGRQLSEASSRCPDGESEGSGVPREILGKELEERKKSPLVLDATEEVILTRSVRKSLKRRTHQDMWEIDMPYYAIAKPGSYDVSFEGLLLKEGAVSFQGLLADRRAKGLSTHVLDLFGSGHFIDDLSVVDTITGVRLIDISQEMEDSLHEQAVGDNDSKSTGRIDHALKRLQTVKESPKHSIIEGNLFSNTPWNQLRGEYDLIVARPGGAFDDDQIFEVQDWSGGREELYALKFLKLLDRAYTRLSPTHGVLMTQVPRFITKDFLPEFIEVAQTEGKIRVSCQSSEWIGREDISLIKSPESTPALADLVKRSIPLWLE